MKQTAKTTGIEGRIINLSSIAHTYTYEEGIRLDDINDQNGYVTMYIVTFKAIDSHFFFFSHYIFQKNFSYSDKKAYGQSKLANILHANELSRRLKVNDFNN